MNRTAAGAAAWWRAPLTIGAPFALAVVEVFHPHPGEWLSLDVSTWLVVHYAQVLLFPPGAPPLLALLGSIALSVGLVAAAVALRGRGASWGPALVLAVSSFGISVFKTHAWPGGPLTFGGIALAAVWLTWEHRADHRRLPTDAS
jgi:hypothetical protein